MKSSRLLVLLILLGAPSIRLLAADIDLGAKAQVTALYSYPNAGHEDQSLEQTISIWLNSSLKRDGLPEATSTIYLNANHYFAHLTGAPEVQLAAFSANYENFLQIGLLGLADADAFKAAGKWSPSWRFLLPLGEAMAHAKTIEIMDFPPVSLFKTQDYLISATTKRWKSLLVANGVNPAELDLYSAILDIVPVAAPASDGSNLDKSGIYAGPFNSYTMPLFSSWGRAPGATSAKPLLAFGAPIRAWFALNFKVQVPVLGLAQVKLPDGTNATVLGSNHPSFFFYAAQKFTGPDSWQKNLVYANSVMLQDLIASGWQAEMGRNPQADPQAVLTAVTAKWNQDPQEVLMLTIMQGDFLKAGGFGPNPAVPSQPDPALIELENSIEVHALLQR
jgi:hypothetical protein